MDQGRNRRRGAISVGILGVAAVIASACGTDPVPAASGKGGGSHAGQRITLVAYSTPREAFERIIPAFQATPAGAGVKFEQSYGPSGDQSRAVEGGLPADVVDLSLEPDLTRLVDAGLVDGDWSMGEHRGIVSHSVVALVVRTGNPKHIDGWDDLLDKDVEVVTPNPFTSGGARWNLMAAYGAWVRGGATPKQALGNLRTLLKNTVVQSTSAREALQVFSTGKGDVLISYENEAITAQRQGEKVEYVIPDSTILIENPGAVVGALKKQPAAAAFVAYLHSAEAQRAFGESGYRPVIDSVLAEFEFERPKDLFTIRDLGGWPKVMDEFFDRDGGSVARIEQGLGVDTDG